MAASLQIIADDDTSEDELMESIHFPRSNLGCYALFAAFIGTLCGLLSGNKQIISVVFGWQCVAILLAGVGVFANALQFSSSFAE